MNKEDSNEGPKIIEGFVHHNNDRFYGTPGIRVRVIEFGDAKWDTRDIPATLVIGSKAIPEGEVVRLRDQIQQARELLKRAKTGTRFARQYQAMVDKDKPATTGIEFDNDVDAFLLSTL